MAVLSEILDREFENARQQGAEIKRSVIIEAKFLNISNPHLSRLRNEKVPLTRDVADKILTAFKDYADSNRLRSDLDEVITKQLQSYTSINSKSSIEERERFSMEKADEMFEKLSRKESLLCVDYRDLPQATDFGAYPNLAEKAGKAVKAGLCFALFQPFGSLENLYKMKDKFEKIERNNLSKNFELSIKAKRFKKSYLYLIELASEVREVYKKMKNAAGGDSENRIVLYESQNEMPNVSGIGIQSRLFLANYFDNQQRYDKIYEWIAVEGNNHFFFERWGKSISATALYAQFNPIPSYWEDSEKRTLPNTIDKLNEAYEKFGLTSILGEDCQQELKWEIWTDN